LTARNENETRQVDASVWLATDPLTAPWAECVDVEPSTLIDGSQSRTQTRQVDASVWLARSTTSWVETDAGKLVTM